MWSNCLLDLGTDFLVGNMVFGLYLPMSSRVRSDSVQTIFLCPHYVITVFTPSCILIVSQQCSHLSASLLCLNSVHTSFLCLHCLLTVFKPSCVLTVSQQF